MLSAAAVSARGYSLKICVANHYNFVMIRGTYEKNAFFLWSSLVVAPADRVRMFDLFRR
jgi:hypothetical protein